jgi:plastocyanin
MKLFSLLLLLLMLGFNVSAQQTFTVTASGTQFSPSLINALIGDKVSFSVGSSHPVLQVDEATFNANGKTALPGGFSFPSGTGTFTATEAGTVYFICVQHISLGMKGKIVISQATGLPSNFSFSDFNIYPNPVEDILYIKNPGILSPISTSVFDMAGKKLFQTDLQNNDDTKPAILVNDLRKGMYFISVIYPDKTYTRKFIKL